ncbi:MAG: metallophosphoesterase family protein [Alphaproteobacteria bacterium]
MKTLICAIGDVHGRLDLLEQLYGSIAVHPAAREAERRVLLHLGDYVDRGPDSKGVIDRARKGLRGFETISLMGNHEALMLDFLDGKPDSEWWVEDGMGGAEALESFGIDPHTASRDLEATKAKIGAETIAWLRALKFSHTEGGYFFAHAGVRPGVPISKQSAEDLIWIRNEFTGSSRDFGARVVHGHSPSPEPEIKRNRVGIDTGAVWTGHLTAALIDPERVEEAPVILTTSGPTLDELNLTRR